MLELVVLAEVVFAEGALEYPSAVIPHAALALYAHRSLKWKHLHELLE